ncbi:MAG TPA: 4'-phosphopantetheinyl transferase superfamily protein [Tepidisphaeraceae bacterium]
MNQSDRTNLESEVHLWHVRLSSVGSPEILSDDERARADRFKFDRDRERFVACRCQLRQILAGYLKVAPGTLRFSYGPHGKPFLRETDLRFNVSHSGDRGLIVVSRGREIGVDIECRNARLDPAELARHFLTPAEAAFVQNTSADEQLDPFLTCWTRKEAWAKAVGVGLAGQLDRFDVSASLGSRLRTLHDRVTGMPWTVIDIGIPPHARAALVVEGAEVPVHRMCGSGSDPAS